MLTLLSFLLVPRAQAVRWAVALGVLAPGGAVGVIEPTAEESGDPVVRPTAWVAGTANGPACSGNDC